MLKKIMCKMTALIVECQFVKMLRKLQSGIYRNFGANRKKNLNVGAIKAPPPHRA